MLLLSLVACGPSSFETDSGQLLVGFDPVTFGSFVKRS